MTDSQPRFDWLDETEDMTKEEIREKLHEEHAREEFGISPPAVDDVFRGDLVIDIEDDWKTVEPLYYTGQGPQSPDDPEYPECDTVAVCYRERELDKHIPEWTAMEIPLLHELADDDPSVERIKIPKDRLRRYEADSL